MFNSTFDPTFYVLCSILWFFFWTLSLGIILDNKTWTMVCD